MEHNVYDPLRSGCFLTFYHRRIFYEEKVRGVPGLEKDNTIVLSRPRSGPNFDYNRFIFLSHILAYPSIARYVSKREQEIDPYCVTSPSHRRDSDDNYVGLGKSIA